jgi:hypothetical protein
LIASGVQKTTSIDPVKLAEEYAVLWTKLILNEFTQNVERKNDLALS